jgi:hypothetical protein
LRHDLAQRYDNHCAGVAMTNFQKRAGILEHFHIHLDDKTEPPSENAQPIQANLKKKHRPIEYVILVLAGLCFSYSIWQVSSQWYSWMVFPAAIFSMSILPLWQVFGRVKFILRTPVSIASVFCFVLTIKYLFTSWNTLPYYILLNVKLGLFIIYYVLRILGFDLRRTFAASHGQRIPFPESNRNRQFSLAFLFQLTLLVAITIALAQLTEISDYIVFAFFTEGGFLLLMVLLMVGHIGGVVSLCASKFAFIIFLVSISIVFGLQMKIFSEQTDIDSHLNGFYFCASLLLFPLLILRFVGYRWSWRLPWKKVPTVGRNAADG